MNLSMAVMKSFGSFTLSTDVTVTGERVGIFGASGSGKSTMVSMLAGLLEPDSGEILLDGECLFSSSKRINVRPEQRRISMVFQQHSLFTHLNVKNNLLYGFKRCHPEHRGIDFDALVRVLNLEEILNREVINLSGGEKQRVSLGRAILANPRLLLMDEPMSALDDNLKFQIIPYLKSVSEQFGIPYLFISHSLVEMRLMAEQVIVVSGGRNAALTTADQLARDRMGNSPVGYINILKVSAPRRTEGLFAYRWGNQELLISAGDEQEKALFELSSKDIILCKRHPEAISARNLIACKVANTFVSGKRIGVELACGDQLMVAEIVESAAEELEIKSGSELFAVIKAVAFRRLG